MSSPERLHPTSLDGDLGEPMLPEPQFPHKSPGPEFAVVAPPPTPGCTSSAATPREAAAVRVPGLACPVNCTIKVILSRARVTVLLGGSHWLRFTSPVGQPWARRRPISSPSRAPGKPPELPVSGGDRGGRGRASGRVDGGLRQVHRGRPLSNRHCRRQGFHW